MEPWERRRAKQKKAAMREQPCGNVGDDSSAVIDGARKKGKRQSPIQKRVAHRNAGYNSVEDDSFESYDSFDSFGEDADINEEIEAYAEVGPRQSKMNRKQQHPFDYHARIPTPPGQTVAHQPQPRKAQRKGVRRKGQDGKNYRRKRNHLKESMGRIIVVLCQAGTIAQGTTSTSLPYTLTQISQTKSLIFGTRRCKQQTFQCHLWKGKPTIVRIP